MKTRSRNCKDDLALILVSLIFLTAIGVRAEEKDTANSPQQETGIPAATPESQGRGQATGLGLEFRIEDQLQLTRLDRISHRSTRRTTCAGQRADRPFPQAVVTQDPLDEVPMVIKANTRQAQRAEFARSDVSTVMLWLRHGRKRQSQLATPKSKCRNLIGGQVRYASVWSHLRASVRYTDVFPGERPPVLHVP